MTTSVASGSENTAEAFAKSRKIIQFYKSRICPWFESGRCHRAENCNYAHSLEELRPRPDLSKTRMCPNPDCDSTYCCFAHFEEELRVTPAYYKICLCKEFQRRRWCTYGSKCRYAHGEQELRHSEMSVLLSEKTNDVQNLSLNESCNSENNFSKTDESIENYSSVQEPINIKSNLLSALYETSQNINSNAVVPNMTINPYNIRPTYYPMYYPGYYTNTSIPITQVTPNINTYPIYDPYYNQTLSVADNSKEEKILNKLNYSEMTNGVKHLNLQHPKQLESTNTTSSDCYNNTSLISYSNSEGCFNPDLTIEDYPGSVINYPVFNIHTPVHQPEKMNALINTPIPCFIGGINLINKESYDYYAYNLHFEQMIQNEKMLAQYQMGRLNEGVTEIELNNARPLQYYE